MRVLQFNFNSFKLEKSSEKKPTQLEMGGSGFHNIQASSYSAHSLQNSEVTSKTFLREVIMKVKEVVLTQMREAPSDARSTTILKKLETSMAGSHV